MASSSRATLVDLPAELHLEITCFLDYPSRLALSQTCSLFTAMINTVPETPGEKLLYLCEAEKWTR